MQKGANMAATVTNNELMKIILEMRQEVGAMTTQVSIMAEAVNRQALLGEENRRTLRGSNGDQGLIARVEAVQKRIEQVENHRALCGIDAVIKTLNGNEKDPGLLERVRKLEELDAAIKRWTWLLLSTVALAVLSMVIDLAPKLIVLLNK